MCNFVQGRPAPPPPPPRGVPPRGAPPRGVERRCAGRRFPPCACGAAASMWRFPSGRGPGGGGAVLRENPDPVLMRGGLLPERPDDGLRAPPPPCTDRSSRTGCAVRVGLREWRPLLGLRSWSGVRRLRVPERVSLRVGLLFGARRARDNISFWYDAPPGAVDMDPCGDVLLRRWRRMGMGAYAWKVKSAYS